MKLEVVAENKDNKKKLPLIYEKRDCRSNFRIPGQFIYLCQCALKKEVYNNSCYSYLMRCK